jgi:2'-5' RNA ligase
MRLFIAVNFDEEVKRRILTVQEKIRKEAEKGTFSPPENVHITLVFLGETPEERLQEIKDAIVRSASVNGKPVPSFTTAFSNAGFFKRGPKELWWLGSDGKENRPVSPAACAGKVGGNEAGGLEELQHRLALELKSRNFVLDSRPFTAHITLGREIRSSLWPFKTETIVIPVKRISLMESRHIPVPGKKTTLVYTELFGYDLTTRIT